MKRISLGFLSLVIISSSLHADNGFSELKKNSAEVYQPGTGAQEGATTSLGASMFAWGLGLTAGIAVLAGVLHQSTSSSH